MHIRANRDEIEKMSITPELSIYLADTYVLSLKTQNYHWNVTGTNFCQLQYIFESQFRGLNKAIEEIAQRIRSLGSKVPCSFKEFRDLTSIEEEGANKLSTTDMIVSLIEGSCNLAKKAYELVLLARRAEDEVSSSVMVNRIQSHENAILMLRSVRE